MSEEPNMHISEESGDEIIDLNDDNYEKDLLKQNEELLKKLALAESKTIERKKGYKKNGEPRKKAEMTDKRKDAKCTNTINFK